MKNDHREQFPNAPNSFFFRLSQRRSTFCRRSFKQRSPTYCQSTVMPSAQRFFLVDAFSSRRFGGNPAAVCLIDSPITDEEKHKLAAEFNLSETVFPEPRDGDWKTATRFGLRWFTPTVEMPLCGHATLATSHVLFNEIGKPCASVTFETKSGELIVSKDENGLLEMDFPQFKMTSQAFGEENQLRAHFPTVQAPEYLMELIKCAVPERITIEGVAHGAAGQRLVVIIDSTTTRNQLENIRPDFKRMMEIHPNGEYVRGIAVTLSPKDPKEQGFIDSKGIPYDYVSRYFSPWEGVDEDPACGSAQCALGPVWSKILEKKELHVYQLFPGRGGEFNLRLPSEDRILIRGRAVTVAAGQLRSCELN